MSLRSVCVYCGSSDGANPAYAEAADRLGQDLARRGITLVYGGGRAGLMGRLADAALGAGGQVIGVIPRFMKDVEWSHERLSELRLVDDIHERKRTMLSLSDGVVALPGGCGTLEELLEAITWKRLGLYAGPVVLVNVAGFFDPCLAMLDQCIAQRFMNAHHRRIWTSVTAPEAAAPALESAAPWSTDALRSASVDLSPIL